MTENDGNRIIRLTIFPPSGPRIQFLIGSNYGVNERGVLFFTDLDGIAYETTVPWALEHIKEGEQKAPFSEAETRPEASTSSPTSIDERESLHTLTTELLPDTEE